jgi:tRNA dimethylallyltransferase
MKPKVVIVLGPTAVGKSDLVFELAGELSAEIINADSQLVYRGMDIGTAKPSKEQRDRIRHHLIDVVDPDDEFNVGRFRALATACIHDMRERHKQPLVCGGTGLYLKALTRGLFLGPAQSPQIREVLHSEFRRNGLGALYQRLEQIDPAATSWIHPHDGQRIVRALEVYELTGKPISEWQKEHSFSERPFQTLKVGLLRERGELYERVNQRCERMIEAGLVEEVKSLLDKGYGLDLKPLQSVGYKQVGLFLTGRMGFADAVFLMKRDTRRLAKRQLTWFRGDNEIQWFHPERERAEIRRSVREFMDWT